METTSNLSQGKVALPIKLVFQGTTPCVFAASELVGQFEP